MKKALTLLLALTLFLFSNETTAQKLTPQQQKVLTDLYKTKKIVYFKFTVNSMQEVKQMGTIITVDKMKGVEVSAHATKEQFTKFLPFNYKYTVVATGGAQKKKASIK
ncbi:hypothetical protein BH10BAC1_BH10BAC1_08710 [soil metagenome]